MEQNKVRTYIWYAIGEVFLVVIGILIALQINNWNEERKLDQTTEVILRQIQMDILSNMGQAEILKKSYNRRDSVFWALKQMELTAEDFKGEEGDNRRSWINTFDFNKMTNEGFEALKDHPGVGPGEYAELINELTLLDEHLYFFNQQIEALIEDRRKHMEYRKTTFDWYSDEFLTGTLSEEQLEFYASNPRLKNYMAYYAGRMLNTLYDGDGYIIQALDTYRTIADLLHQKEDELPDMIRNYYADLPSDSLVKFVGTYELSYAPPLNTVSHPSQWDSIRIEFDTDKKLLRNIYQDGEHYKRKLSVRSGNLLEDTNNKIHRIHYSLTEEGALRVKHIIGQPHIFKKVRN